MVQGLGPEHKAILLWRFKVWQQQAEVPILASSPHTSTAMELGSMSLPPTQVRRSTRHGRGSNGRDVQLDKLGNILTAPTRQEKRRFAPSDGLSLPDNLLAPVPKRRRKNKKVFTSVLIHHSVANT
jgi:hypothetical protein